MTLDLDERMNYLWEFGNYLMTREENDCRVDLFKLNTYYVEVYYNMPDYSIEDIKSFKSEVFLTDYLELIDIDCLFTV